MKIEVLEYGQEASRMRMATTYNLKVRLPNGEVLERRIEADELSLRSATYGGALEATIKERLKREMRKAIADRIEFVL